MKWWRAWRDGARAAIDNKQSSYADPWLGMAWEQGYSWGKNRPRKKNADPLTKTTMTSSTFYGPSFNGTVASVSQSMASNAVNVHGRAIPFMGSRNIEVTLLVEQKFLDVVKRLGQSVFNAEIYAAGQHWELYDCWVKSWQMLGANPATVLVAVGDLKT